MGNFYSDVICKDLRFASLTRVDDPSLLEPATRQLVQSLVLTAQQMGIEVHDQKPTQPEPPAGAVQRRRYQTSKPWVFIIMAWPATSSAWQLESLAGKVISPSSGS